MIILLMISKGKDEVNPITSHEGPQGSRGLALLFP